MKVCDYITAFLLEQGIRDIFGFPGGMVTRLMNSFSKSNDMHAHLTYHEQAASFCACSYAQTSDKVGVAYATSGPGATNLLTGLCNAYFDSIPVLFITGQVNTYELKKCRDMRQHGFQETDIVSMVKNFTKYSVLITDANDIRYHLEKAFYFAKNGRPGPVLLDIPMDIQNAEVEPESLKTYVPKKTKKAEYDSYEKIRKVLLEHLSKSKRPVILAGNGINTANVRETFFRFVKNISIPVLTSMLAVDLFQSDFGNYFGFVGAYGHRSANFVFAKSDLIISLGSRMDIRQTGSDLSTFQKDVEIIKIDVDPFELQDKICNSQESLYADLRNIMPLLADDDAFVLGEKYKNWHTQCSYYKKELLGIDDLYYNKAVSKISEIIPKNSIITTDVGQNQVWVAQSFRVKEKQRILFSGGHGAMGYSLPAAIGACYNTKLPVYCFSGDGGIQMNIQELQYIVRENLPVKIILLNNYALGMIRHFQEMYFEADYMQTIPERGYLPPDFERVFNAYGISVHKMNGLDEIDNNKEFLLDGSSRLFLLESHDPTYVFPKLAYMKPIYDQEPLIERELFDKLNSYSNT